MAPIASDGLPARESGEWASDKLFYVARYIDIFTTGMSGKWRRRVYVDLMSGPGLCVVPSTRREFDGSPLLALKTRTPFTDVILVEAEPELADALAVRTQAQGLRPRPVLLRSDCNDPHVIEAIRGVIGGDSLVLGFVDLLGTNVSMAPLRALTWKLPMDLIVTFPEMDIVRNWKAARAGDPEHADRFDQFFGTSQWRTAADGARRGERESVALMNFYADQLHRMDYLTSVLPSTMKNSKGGTLYRPIFASRHARGIDFWTKISAKRDPSGQGRLI